MNRVAKLAIRIAVLGVLLLVLFSVSSTATLAQDNVVEAGTATVETGQTFTVPVTARSITATSGLGAYDVMINYNPSVINATGCAAGDAPFSAPSACNTAVSGQVSVNGYHTVVPGPRGDILLFRLVGSALAGAGGLTTPLTVTISSLVDPYDVEIMPRSTVTGTVTVTVAVETPTATPVPPTATPTATPTPTPTPTLTANFVGSPTVGLVPFSVVFTDTSTGSPNQWWWSFGDGSTQALTGTGNTTHDYNTAGIYTVSLVVTNTAMGLSDDETKPSYITATGIVADFIPASAQGPAPLRVVFTDTSRAVAITSGSVSGPRTWAYGDGDTESGDNKYVVTHTYHATGIYSVTLTAFGNVDGVPKSNIITRTNCITVTPVANFTASITEGVWPLTVYFTDTSTGTITSRAWDLNGDGLVDSTAQNTSRVYTQTGLYTVSLVVTGTVDGLVMADTTTPTRDKVVLVKDVMADFTAIPRTGKVPLLVNFTDGSVAAGGGTVFDWLWSFGDGITSTAQNPTHAYTNTGVYAVSLTARASVPDVAGVVSDTETKTRCITARPSAEFVGTTITGTREGLVPLAVTFTDTTTGTVASRLWRFGDDTISTAPITTHVYTRTGTFDVSLTITGTVAGAVPVASVDTITKPGYITAKSVDADFTAAPTSGPMPLVVTFTNRSVGPITSALTLWNFGDGVTKTDSAATVTHQYATSEIYTPALTVCGAGVCDTQTGVIVIKVAPKPYFGADPTEGLVPLTVAFTGNATGTVTTWRWDFGDGLTSTLQSPTHVYDTHGVYTVSLRATGLSGSDIVTRPSYIWPRAIMADFTPESKEGPVPLRVVFSDTSRKVSGATIDGCFWNFGDSFTSLDWNPVHTYTVPGPYTVTLLITGTGSAVVFDTVTKTNCVTATAKPLDVRFTAEPREVLVGQVVSFTDLSVPTAVITARAWDFGDGGTSTSKNPTHTYAALGPYTVTLAVTGRLDGVPVVVTEPKRSFISVQDVVAGFTAYPVAGVAPLTVRFTDTSTATLAIATRLWNFGDGSAVLIGNQQNPVHTYTLGGPYTVTLRAVDAAFNADNVTGTIVVYNPVAAAFSASPLTTTVGATVTFTDASTNAISWLWTFGDGITSTAQNPTHAYSAAGTYTVTLTVTGLGGDSATETKASYIHVYNPVVAAFSALPTSGDIPLVVAFTNASTGHVASWLWNFGDGGTSTLQNPAHTYSAAGTYTVTLTVTGSGGDSDIETKASYITAREATVIITPTLSPIITDLVVVWGWNTAITGYEGYAPDYGLLTLGELERGKGYWFNLSAPATWTYGANTYRLVAGWNLIGWLGATAPATPTTTPITGAVSTITSGLVVVWGFDSATQTYQGYAPTHVLYSLTNLVAGQGYWFYLNNDAVLNYGGNTYNLKAGWNLIGWLGS